MELRRCQSKESTSKDISELGERQGVCVWSRVGTCLAGVEGEMQKDTYLPVSELRWEPRGDEGSGDEAGRESILKSSFGATEPRQARGTGIKLVRLNCQQKGMPCNEAEVSGAELHLP